MIRLENRCDSAQTEKLIGMLPFLSVKKAAHIIKFISTLRKMQEEGTDLITVEEMSAIAVKCFGPEILTSVRWGEDFETRISDLCQFFGLPSEQLTTLAAVLESFKGV